MKDMGTPHQRMQELCDCFAETDPLKEMAMVHADVDKEEAALKWLALAVLHGVDRNAKKDLSGKDSRRDHRSTAAYRDTSASITRQRDRKQDYRNGETDHPHRG